MTAPDLPMRERIAEALNLAGWTCSGGIHEPGLFHECEDCRETCLAQADAVLDLWADLPDAAVEAGIHADKAHMDYRFARDDGVNLTVRCNGPACNGWEGTTVSAWEAHRVTAILTAAIAAIKEGKA